MSSEFNRVNSLIAQGCTSPPAYLHLSPIQTLPSCKRRTLARKKWKQDQKVKDFCQTLKRRCLPRTFFLLKVNGKSISAGGGGGGCLRGIQDGNEKVERAQHASCTLKRDGSKGEKRG